MAGSSELMTSGWSSNINAAAGWFRRSLTSFITCTSEVRGTNARLRESVPALWTVKPTAGTAYLVGNGAHFHRHAPLPGQKLGEGMSGQGEPVADTRRVQQQSIQHVLIHLRTLHVFTADAHKSESAFMADSWGLPKAGASKLTGFPGVEVEGKGHPLLCWQGQGFSEVPQGSTAVFTAHLYTINKQSHQTEGPPLIVPVLAPSLSPHQNRPWYLGSRAAAS